MAHSVTPPRAGPRPPNGLRLITLISFYSTLTCRACLLSTVYYFTLTRPLFILDDSFLRAPATEILQSPKRNPL